MLPLGKIWCVFIGHARHAHDFISGDQNSFVMLRCYVIKKNQNGNRGRSGAGTAEGKYR